MDREILFKAKRLSDGEWVGGFPYWGEFSGAFILQNKAYSRRDARTGEILLGDDVVPIEVDPSTICEYTGLTDKNGKKVFVGDIVKCSKGCPHEVVWLQGYGGTFVGGMPAIYLSELMPGYAWTGEEEIIGSIHDGEGGQREEG